MRHDLIYTSYSPNTRQLDLRLNQNLLLDKSSWIEGEGETEIVGYFNQYYPKGKIYTFNYARSALYFFLEKLPHNSGDEIIFQGFTCAASSLPAIWAGYKPVYADIESGKLVMKPESVKELINPRTKVLVIQCTMGHCPDIEALVDIARENELILIEDCTHYLPHKGSTLYGQYGDVSIFSFGRDKVVSGVDGGVLLVNNPEYVDHLDKGYRKLVYPNSMWIFKRLLFSPIWHYYKKYNNSVWSKLIHWFATNLGLLTRATSQTEKNGYKPDYIPARLPNSLAELASLQLEEIDQFQEHRLNISNIYRSQLKGSKDIRLLADFDIAPLRFPLLISNKSEVISKLMNRNIQIGDWYSKPVSPKEVKESVSCYIAGSCKVSESVAKDIINLPTHINVSQEDARRIVKALKEISKE